MSETARTFNFYLFQHWEPGDPGVDIWGKNMSSTFCHSTKHSKNSNTSDNLASQQGRSRDTGVPIKNKNTSFQN